MYLFYAFSELGSNDRSLGTGDLKKKFLSLVLHVYTYSVHIYCLHIFK